MAAPTLGSDCHALRNHLRKCHSLLTTYKWLTDSFVLVRNIITQVIAFVIDSNLDF